ncbi:MAG TPA: methionine adenosyltransferase, partial [Nocardioidaceae bacterium]|nr:methionine adenosyltransferase [Nocardioidaceae bacterium]
MRRTDAGRGSPVGRLFTSESVTEGHPDKIADQISDTVLDALLAKDPYSRVAVETLVTTGLVVVAGEVTTEAYAPIAQLVRDRVLDIGYDSSNKGFDGWSCGVQVAIGSQSPDIAQGVDTAYEGRSGDLVDDLDRQGAGDQGLMFGYACDETPELMPLPISLAHRLARRLAEVRKTRVLPYLRLDGKVQVTVLYDEAGEPVSVEDVVVSAQHHDDVTTETLRGDVREQVIDAVIPSELRSQTLVTHINPTGRFVIGGPAADAGLTGRKVIVDTYGGYARHGG